MTIPPNNQAFIDANIALEKAHSIIHQWQISGKMQTNADGLTFLKRLIAIGLNDFHSESCQPNVNLKPEVNIEKSICNESRSPQMKSPEEIALEVVNKITAGYPTGNYLHLMADQIRFAIEHRDAQWKALKVKLPEKFDLSKMGHESPTNIHRYEGYNRAIDDIRAKLNGEGEVG